MQCLHAHFEPVDFVLQALKLFCIGCFLQMPSSWKRHKVDEDKSQNGPKRGRGKAVVRRAVSGTIDDEAAGEHCSLASSYVLRATTMWLLTELCSTLVSRCLTLIIYLMAAYMM